MSDDFASDVARRKAQLMAELEAMAMPTKYASSGEMGRLAAEGAYAALNFDPSDRMQMISQEELQATPPLSDDELWNPDYAVPMPDAPIRHEVPVIMPEVTDQPVEPEGVWVKNSWTDEYDPYLPDAGPAGQRMAMKAMHDPEFQQRMMETPLVSYEYNQEAQQKYGMPPGQRVGTMADQVPREMRAQGPDGVKALLPDETAGAAAGSAALAMKQNSIQDTQMAALNERLRRLENIG